MARLDDFLNALSSQESGGNYSAVNKNTGALGRWQVMPANVPAWSRKYLGMTLTPQQFLRSPQMQDRLVRAVLGSYVSKYGFRGAASAWYSGNPAWENNYNPQRYGPSIGGYVDSVMKKMGSTGISGALTAIADQAIIAATKTARTVPGVKPDPLEISQGQGLIPNPSAEQRKNEPEATKGLGLDIQDGSGQGQLGMEAGQGIDDKTPLGISTDATSFTPTSGRETIGPDPVVSPVDALKNTATGIFNLAGNGFKYYNPVPGFKPSGTWGTYPTSHGKHLALDFAVPQGTQVRSPLSGQVIFAGWDPNAAKTNGGFGLSLRIKLDDGNYVILGHLSSIGSMKVGTRVGANQVVGLSGSTGHSSGPHLHMEFRHAAWDPDSAFNFTNLFKW